MSNTKNTKPKRRGLITPVDISFIFFISLSTITRIIEYGFSVDIISNFVLILIVALLMISNNKKENKILDLEEKLKENNKS